MSYPQCIPACEAIAMCSALYDQLCCCSVQHPHFCCKLVSFNRKQFGDLGKYVGTTGTYPCRAQQKTLTKWGGASIVLLFREYFPVVYLERRAPVTFFLAFTGRRSSSSESTFSRSSYENLSSIIVVTSRDNIGHHMRMRYAHVYTRESEVLNFQGHDSSYVTLCIAMLGQWVRPQFEFLIRWFTSAHNARGGY